MSRASSRFAVSALIALAGVAALWAAGRQNRLLLEERKTLNLTQADPLENTPPLVAFTTVALGGFRGVLADVLWLRLSDLQEQGRYFEIVQLADWVTKLQPRFASIWVFHAWNMTYNISVMMASPEDRWRWVSNGIRLLRDEGLLYNPGSAMLYRELSWFFFHKLGDDIDQAHAFYKRVWADEMEDVLGGAHPDYDALLAAPATPVELSARPGMADLEKALRDAGADPLDGRLLTPAGRAPAVDAALAAHPDAAKEWRAFLQARRLRGIYKMDPAFMKTLDAELGPFDWRTPHAHAIYWARMGLPFARQEFDRMSLDRSVFNSVSKSFLRGRIVRDREKDIFLLTPNVDMLPRARENYLRAIRDYPEQQTMRDAYMNFLLDAIMISFSYNRRAEAADLFREMKERYPAETKADRVEDLIFSTYEEFAREATTAQAQMIVEGAFYQSFFWEALGDREQAAGFDQLARLCHEQFMALRGTDPEWLERTGLMRDIEKIRGQALERARQDLGEKTP